jgi:hypothetical protein
MGRLGEDATSMSISANSRRAMEHFEPEAALDPQAQRQMRGHLEQIDFAAFAANQEVLAKTVGRMELARFQRLAVAAAHARARWVAAALSMSEKPDAPTADESARLGALRTAYEELSHAYDALRRMVERGYVAYSARTPGK